MQQKKKNSEQIYNVICPKIRFLKASENTWSIFIKTTYFQAMEIGVFENYI